VAGTDFPPLLAGRRAIPGYGVPPHVPAAAAGQAGSPPGKDFPAAAEVFGANWRTSVFF